MTTAVVDNEQRVRIPNLKPGEVVAYRDNGDDTITLTKVNGEAKEPFPEGSLLEYMTPERDAEMTEIAKACIIGMPEDFKPE